MKNKGKKGERKLCSGSKKDRKKMEREFMPNLKKHKTVIAKIQNIFRKRRRKKNKNKNLTVEKIFLKSKESKKSKNSWRNLSHQQIQKKNSNL